MSEEKEHKPSTIWNSKLRAKRQPKRSTVGHRKSIKDEVDEGYRYFWSRRKINQYHTHERNTENRRSENCVRISIRA